MYNEEEDRDDLLAVPTPGACKLDAVLVVDGEKLEDCAHFLSECRIAGGLRIQEQWSAPMLLMALRESPVPKTSRRIREPLECFGRSTCRLMRRGK